MKKKVIVAEDDPALLDVLQLVLQRAGYEVKGYPNGNRILRSDFEVPDIFLIDKQLSGTDGLDICRFLKQQEITRQIPVIILSASPGIELLVKHAGADAFVEKPFSNNDLVLLIQRLVK